jgi:cytochrome c oxidase assembly protein subunit 15
VNSQGPSLRWTRRVAGLLAGTTFLLLLAGGLVTTYRVGMAVNDWPTTFGYSMLSYPLDEMLENTGVTQEHSHRLLGTLVGILTMIAMGVSASAGGRRARNLMFAALGLEVALVASVVMTKAVFGPLQAALFASVLAALTLSYRVPAERVVRGAAIGAHLAVVFQGLLGGTRVLENSQQLAFLHGTCAQLVFVVVVILFVVSGDAWRGARPVTASAGASLSMFAWVAILATFTQVVLGAWLRHTGGTLPLFLHLVCALLVTTAIALLWTRLGRAASSVTASAPLIVVRRWLLSSLVLQWLLGGSALAAILILSGGFEGPVTAAEGITATAHVGIGALLLSGTVAALLWSRRLIADPAGS